MRKEYDEYLTKKYPKIFKNRYGDIKKTCLAFGYECNDGWYDIIEKLCYDIQTYLDEHPEIEQVVATQVKEKLGGLCFYTDGGDEHTFRLAREAEKLSYKTCEFCGTTENVGMTRGWYYTICKDCYDKSENNIKSLVWELNKK